MHNLIKKALVYSLVGFLVFPLFTFSVLADDMPSGDELRSQITESANTEVNNSFNQTSTETSVTNTGDDVTIDNSSENNTSVDVNNNNTAVVNQVVDATANTGNNEASRNISFGGNAGTINTGDASVNVSGEFAGNYNTTGIYGLGGGCTSSTDVVNTGDNLDLDSNCDSTLVVGVNNNNTAVINQVVDAEANTGGNRADRNIAIGGGTAGAITTGDASTSVDFLVAANGSVTFVGGESNGNGPGTGASIILVNTGDGSRISNLAESLQRISVNNNNTLVANQVVQAVANTGDNTANRNINTNGDAGVIVTGDAYVGVSMDVSGNENETSIALGGTGTSSQADIINTGDDLEVNNESTSETEIDVNNNNTAVVNQVVLGYANTGNNTANRNISFGGNAGYIETGDATVDVELTVDVNRNTTEINLGSESNSENTITPCVGASSIIDVVNTGDDVTIDSSATSELDINVNNNNTLVANQVVDAVANTGGNTANRNIGDSTIHTGDAVVDVGMEVRGNVNQTTIDCAPIAQVITPTPQPPTPTPSQGGQGGTTTTTTTTTTTNTVVAAAQNVGGGEVLGVTAQALPATGPRENLLVMLFSLMALAAGYYLKNYKSKSL